MVELENPAPLPARESPESIARCTRHGLRLFALYLALYGAFVLMNAFAPEVMARSPWGGINLAVVSGLGLIAFAFCLALLYDWLCRPLAAESEGEDVR